MLIAPVQRRARLVIDDFDPGPLRDRLTLLLPTNATFGARRIGVRLTVEQSPDGVKWWPVGGMYVDDWAAKLDWLKSPAVVARGKGADALRLRLKEGLIRGDVYRDQKYAQWGGAVHEIRDSDDVETYYAMALCRRLRLTVEPTEPISFGLDVVADNRPKPGTPIGRRSASLLGVFSAAEGAGAVTTGSRTTTSGSLITATYSMWNTSSPAAGNPAASTDNKSNTYAEPSTDRVVFSSGAGSFGTCHLSYNLAGTRGASHTVSHADEGNNAIGAQEWDGIDSGPTVTVNAASTGTTSAPSDGPGTVPAASLVILVFGYDSAATTMAVSDGTEAQEIDENNDQQACAVHYKVAQTGSPTITGTLGRGAAWGALAVAFQESGGAAPTSEPPRQILSPVFLAM